MALHPVPMTATRLPVEAHVVPPARGVERRAFEALQTCDRWDGRDGQLAARRQQDVGFVRPGARVEQPLGAPGVPAGSRDLGVRADPVDDAITMCDVLEVRLDLGLRRVPAGPARVGLERELVEVRWDVARGTRIGVVMPDAADAVSALEDRDVVIARALQHHDRADATETATDYRDRPLLRPCMPVPIRLCWSAHVAHITYAAGSSSAECLEGRMDNCTLGTRGCCPPMDLGARIGAQGVRVSTLAEAAELRRRRDWSAAYEAYSGIDPQDGPVTEGLAESTWWLGNMERGDPAVRRRLPPVRRRRRPGERGPDRGAALDPLPSGR